MKKIIFSILVLGTFATYAIFVAQNKQGTEVPIALDKNPATVPANIPLDTTSTGPASSTPPLQAPDQATLPTSTPAAPPTNTELQLQAQGTVLISSTYTSPLTLVKTTRVVTADGKLYRLAETVVVPSEGQIRATVYADQNGSLYAIGPTSFSIPGLSASLQPYVTVTSDSSFSLAQPLATQTAPAPVAQPAVSPAPQPKPTPAPQPTPTPAPAPKPKGQYQDGTFTGDSVDAYYGNVQVEAIIQGGKITDVQFLDYPQDRNRSVAINSYAMPNLTSEAIQAQSANVDGVSGATATSDAFRQSLASALAQAKN